MIENVDTQKHEQPPQTIVHDVRFVCEALKWLQVLFGAEPTSLCDPSLADVADLIHYTQERFGQDASLEQVIQTLSFDDAAGQVTEDLLARLRKKAQERQNTSAAAQQAILFFTSLPEVLAS